MIKSFKLSKHSIKNWRFASSLSLGVLGPSALGKETQTLIHNLTGNVIPQGWQHQIKNDVVINYNISFEKQLFRFRDLFYITNISKLEIGTLFSNTSSGLSLALGKVNTPFSKFNKNENFQLFIFIQPLLNFIGYDATLQGGFFNKKSPYTLPSNEITRFTAQLKYGVVLKFNKLYLEYMISKISSETKHEAHSSWGGIRVGIRF